VVSDERYESNIRQGSNEPHSLQFKSSNIEESEHYKEDGVDDGANNKSAVYW